MNLEKFQELADHYTDAFEMTNSKPHIEYYKWQIAKKFRPAMDAALAASDEDFPKKFSDVRKLTRNLIDSNVQPFGGLVEFAKKEPRTVRKMFQDLFATAEKNVETKEKEIYQFMDASHALRDKYFPDSFRYTDDLHSVTGYLFLYDPDHSYLYKATHCRIFADCVEFYDDWGSGPDTKLDIFYRMCDECIEAINNSPALLATAESRFDIDREGMHPDTAKHILLFDMMYCCSTYHLFSGIHIVTPKSKERQLMQERKEKAIRLQQALDEANAKASELENVLGLISAAAVEGAVVHHKSFGAGKITGIRDGRPVISFESVGDKELGIKQSIVNRLITIDGFEFSEEQMNLLKSEERIGAEVSTAEKALVSYLEYLD